VLHYFDIIPMSPTHYVVKLSGNIAAINYVIVVMFSGEGNH